MTIQTRRQARLAEELRAAAQAVAVSHPATPPSATDTTNGDLQSYGSCSSLSTLTPTSSFSSESSNTEITTQDGGHLDAIAETDAERDAEDDNDMDEDEDNAPSAPETFSAPRFPFRHRRQPLITPEPSLTHRYPSGVLETPRKRITPSEKERLAAERARDAELVASEGLAKLTQEGTLLVHESSSELDVHRTGRGLGSPFTSPGPSAAGLRVAHPMEPRRTAPPSRYRPIESIPTLIVNPNTGEVESFTVARG